jgi:hypothetical protein
MTFQTYQSSLLDVYRLTGVWELKGSVFYVVTCPKHLAVNVLGNLKGSFGLLQVAAETIKATLDKLPGFPRTQIGFLTFDSMLHFYNLKACHAGERKPPLCIDTYNVNPIH